jgi:Holin of 3TMs, for gene-transfer release
MGLMARLMTLLTGQSLRIEELAALLKAQFDRPEGAGMVGLRGRPKAGFDRAMDALNRLPRPFMALGTLALIAAALIDPVWFSARMDALAQVPEALWWLIGTVISLFFGARYQTQGQQFQREVIGALVNAAPPLVSPQVAATGADARLTLTAEAPGGNPALSEWLSTLT